jgi:hypothetical protein
VRQYSGGLSIFAGLVLLSGVSAAQSVGPELRKAGDTIALELDSWRSQNQPRSDLIEAEEMRRNRPQTRESDPAFDLLMLRRKWDSESPDPARSR